MTTHEILVKARNLIGDEKDWYPGLGHGRGGLCALTALAAVREPGLSALCGSRELGNVLGCMPWEVADFNNSHSHAEVLAAFDKAIAATAPAPDLDFLTVPEQVAA